MKHSYDPGFDPDPDIIKKASRLARNNDLRDCLEEFVADQLSIVRDSNPNDTASRENAYHAQRGAEMFVVWIEGLMNNA